MSIPNAQKKFGGMSLCSLIPPSHSEETMQGNNLLSGHLDADGAERAQRHGP